MKDYPVIIIAIAFILGILIKDLFAISLVIIVVLFVLSILLFFAAKHYKIYRKVKFLLSILVLLLIVLLGNYYAELNLIKKNVFFTNIYSENNVTVYGKIKKVELQRTDRIIFYVLSDSIRAESFFVKDNLTFLCNVKDTNKNLSELYADLHPGNLIKVKSRGI